MDPLVVARTLYGSEYLKRFLAQGIRPDGRQPTRARPVAISGNECPMICRIGNSMVACGVKLELAAPKAETPDEGYFGISHHKNKFYVQIVINIMLFSTLWNA
jgi:exosome complex component RRP43